ncbi:MAG: universal stress protein [Bacteroidetes bacterium]|nr:universal stress protein [Bacteroidota bacterium]
MDNSRIKEILVPLDGSALAESVLPAVARLAKKIDGSVTFMHVIEQNPPERVHGQRHLTRIEQAEKYLDSVASLPLFEGVSVNVHVHETGVRDVSQSISDHSEELSQDLIVMCTHGNSGLHDLLVGSIAQQVISLSGTPVMLVNPSIEKPKAKSNFENFLIPLDGNPEHEHALKFASSFARLCSARIHLMIAVPRFGTMSGELTAANRFLPGTTRRMMDMIVPDARNYLLKVQTEIALGGLEVTTSTSRGDPARAISKTSKSIKADLIVLATHGKKGARPFWEGSVTPRISRTSKIPLLLIPVRE